MDNELQHIPKRIMLIDDDPFSVMLSKMKLKSVVEEQDIIEYYDTNDALEFLGQHLGKESAMIPNLILLEVMMDEAKGWDFIPQFSDLIVKSKTKIQLIILTSSQFFSDYRKALKFEMVKGFMMKPLKNEMLLEIYNNALCGKVNAGNKIFESFIV